jgi:hypothetical protein
VQARGNTAGVSTHPLGSAVNARYVRLDVINATQSGTGGTTRIYEFEVHA